MLLGLIIAGTAFVLVPPEWQASALIQVGQSARLGISSTPQGDSPEIVVAKIMRPAFIKAAMQRAGRPDMVEPLLPSIYKGRGLLKARAMNPGIVVITLRAPTPELAKQLMDSVATEVLEEQNRDVESRIHYAERALQNGKKDNPRIEAETSTAFLSNTLATLEDLRAHMVGEAEVLGEPAFPDPYSFAALGLVLGVLLTAGLLYWAKPRL